MTDVTFDYAAEFRQLEEAVRMIAPMLLTVDVENISKALYQDVDTIGPILFPTEWIRGQRNIAEQREFFAAVSPLVRFLRLKLAQQRGATS